MGLEGDLKALGFKLSRPLRRDSYDFAYRTEGVIETNLIKGLELLRSVGILEEQLVNGYTNVRMSLWNLHSMMGWPEASCLAIQESDCFESVKLRISYLNHLLEPFVSDSEGPLDQDLRKLLQMIHFPALYQSANDDLGQYFWNFTLERNLRKLHKFTQSQIYCICMGFCKCSKTGTCAQ